MCEEKKDEKMESDRRNVRLGRQRQGKREGEGEYQ